MTDSIVIPPSLPAQSSPDLGYVLGTLVAQVTNLGKTLEQQNVTSQRNKEEQDKREEESRKGFLKSFEILTSSVAAQTKILQDHITDDNSTKTTVAEHEKWKEKQAQPILDDYVANKNRITGARWMGGVVGACIAALVSLFFWAVNTSGGLHVG